MAGKKNRDVTFNSATGVSQYLGRELLKSIHQPNLLQYRPHQKQVLFHRSEKKKRLYVGGNRSGKTVGGVVEDLYWLRNSHPWKNLPIPDSEPCRGRVVATDFINGVDKIILPQFAQWTPKSMLVGGSWTQSYDKAHKVLSFENGAFVEFMSYDQDLDKFAGTSRHFCHFDEEPPQPIYTECMMRLIDTGGHTWFTMTPVEGMTWVYDEIYEPGILGSRLIDVIVVDMTENPYLNKVEIADFVEGLSEDEREARMHGRFVQMGGLIYKMFDPSPGGKHVIKGRWRPPKNENWKIGLGLDHGLNNPTCVGFHAYNEDGDVITFDEWYKSGLVVSEHARYIKRKLYSHNISLDDIEIMVADPSIRNRDPNTGTSVQQEYAKYGIYWALGNNDVEAGLERVTNYLKPIRASGHPRWRAMENCKMHTKEMARYRWKTYETKQKNYENNAYEEPHKHNDHAPDELRYFLMARPDIVNVIEQARERSRHRFDSSVASSGTWIAGQEEQELFEEEHELYRQGYSFTPGGSGMTIDEHMGGLW